MGSAISKFLIWGGVEIWGGKCCLESRIWGGGKFGVENAISKFLIWGGGGKFGAENAISNLEFGG